MIAYIIFATIFYAGIVGIALTFPYPLNVIVIAVGTIGYVAALRASRRYLTK